jgi:type I restriction enzyme, S subunit
MHPKPQFLQHEQGGGMELMAGYKHSDVGVIPADWDVMSLGELTTLVASGRSAIGKQIGDYPVHGSTGIIGNTMSPEYVGDAILVARVGANAGRLNYVSGKYGVTDNTIIIRMNADCCLPFFWRQLEAKRLNKLVFGSGQPLITGTQLKALPLAIPSVAEQHAIAQALSDVDALLDGLNQLIAKKQGIKQAAMQQLLTGKTRLPGFHGEWEVKRLGDLSNLYQPQTISANEFTESGFPVYGANGVIGYYHSANHSTWQVTVTCRGSTCGTVNRTVDQCWITGTRWC